MSGKKVKLAIIRGNGVRECPFGLDIENLEACKCAGKSVKHMAPISGTNPAEQNEKLTNANKIVYAYQKEDQHCMYSDELLEKYNKVDCNYGDYGQGIHSTDFRGSPLYVQTFNTTQLNTYPLSEYADNQRSRNLFLGWFSLIGGFVRETINKISKRK